MSSFLIAVALTLCIGHADRPSELSILVSELTEAEGTCDEQAILQSIEDQMGVERRQWIESQSPGFEISLHPLFKVLPRTPNGNLRPDVAKYALHRVFVDARGWFVKGLEEFNMRNASSLPSLVGVLQGQVPSAVLEAFGPCVDQEVAVRPLALLAAALDELVHREVLQRTTNVFKSKRLPVFGNVDIKQMEEVLEQVMLGYILDAGAIPAAEQDKYLSGELDVMDKYPNWPELRRFLRSIQEILAPAKSGVLKFDDLADIIKELNEHYGHWQDGECQILSRELQELEDQCPGHVSLHRFYAAQLYHDKWQFSESAEYLRSLGALEENDVQRPRLVSTNYVLGPNNCVSTSRFYSQCCLNRCDRHLSKLERALQAPEASPKALWAAVAAVLPQPEAAEGALETRLDRIASAGNGKVALHGHHFAEWLHHAYPRECPAPHHAGVLGELPEEYESRTGLEPSLTTQKTKEYLEMSKLDSKGEGTCNIPWMSESMLLPDLEWNEEPQQARRLMELGNMGSPAALAGIGMVLAALAGLQLAFKARAESI